MRARILALKNYRITTMQQLYNATFAITVIVAGVVIFIAFNKLK